MTHARSPWKNTTRGVLAIIGVVGLIVVAQAIVREVQRRRSVQHEIDGLASEVQRLEDQRGQLTDLLKHADSPEFIEREARLRLGLQKPGESVLIVRDGPVGAPVAPGGGLQPSGTVPVSNARRWWQRMFR